MKIGNAYLKVQCVWCMVCEHLYRKLSLEQWEVVWVAKHPDFYEGEWHQRAVIGNIEKRYYIKEATKRVVAFTTTHTTKDRLEMEDFFSN